MQNFRSRLFLGKGSTGEGDGDGDGETSWLRLEDTDGGVGGVGGVSNPGSSALNRGDSDEDVMVCDNTDGGVMSALSLGLGDGEGSGFALTCDLVAPFLAAFLAAFFLSFSNRSLVLLTSFSYAFCRFSASLAARFASLTSCSDEGSGCVSPEGSSGSGCDGVGGSGDEEWS